MINADHGRTPDDAPVLLNRENLALELVNTEVIKRGKHCDLLTIPQDVARWWQAVCQHHSEIEEVCAEDEEITAYDMVLLNALKILRTALRAIFSALVAGKAPEKANVSVLNEVLKTGYPSLDLTSQGDLRPVYRTRDSRTGRVLLPIALSALHLIQTGERKRLHRCENERCILFFYDTTRSATRRWCSLGCMDRARSIQRYQQAKQRQL
jgi:predicted RNA-binding Zn ribbon-like protein